MKAIDDVNSGLITNPTIVLFGNVTLSSPIEIKYPCKIDLNGYDLILSQTNTLTLLQSGTVELLSSGSDSTHSAIANSIIIDNTDAIFNIDDSCLNYSDCVNIVNYNESGTIDLLIERLENKIGYGLTNNQAINVFGGLKYASGQVVITTTDDTNYSYTNGTITANSSSRTVINSIAFEDNEFSFSIVGTGNDAIHQSILTNELKHVPNSTNGIYNGDHTITNDLFLPKAIPSKNVTITWHSSDETAINSNGELVGNTKGTVVVMYATIRVNNSVYSDTFTFKVSSQNNETRFIDLMAQLSPITLNTVYKPATSNEDLAYFFLPIINENTKYDYRETYTTPYGAGGDAYEWVGYAHDIGLEEIEYQMINTYNYITVLDSATDNTNNSSAVVYLNTYVFYTFGQITAKGKFKNDDTIYEVKVNIIIELGDNDELQDMVFNYVSGELHEDRANVLRNIISTRREFGMANEKGDFYLPSTYMSYSIVYDIPNSVRGIIKEIVAPGATGEDGVTNDTQDYLIRINPEGFYTTDGTCGVTVSIKLASLPPNYQRESRILYFDIPGALHCDLNGFINPSVFTAVKYQVFTQLPANERAHESGFVLNNGIITNNTGNYILQYDINARTTDVVTGEASTYEGCKTLAFTTDANHVGTNNEKAIYLSTMLEWAVSNDVVIDPSGYTENYSNGLIYVDANEKASIKNYFIEATGCDSATFESVWAESVRQESGCLFTKDNSGKYFLDAVRSTISTIVDSYFKCTEIIQWATDEREFGIPTDVGFTCTVRATPNSGTIRNRDWNINLDAIRNNNITITTTNFATYCTSSNASTTTGRNSQCYTEAYADDETAYMSNNEATMLLQFLFNTFTNNTTQVNILNSFIEYTTKPTYLKVDGTNKLVCKLYELLGIDVHGFTTRYMSGVIEANNTTCDHIVAVSTIDGSNVGINYFKALETLYVKAGNPSMFHTSESMEVFFTRLTTYNKELSTLVLIGCALDNVVFDLSRIVNISKLENLDISGNSGISNIGYLLQLDMSQLNYVNICGVDVLLRYSEFTLASIYLAGNLGNTIYYYPDNTTIKTLYTESSASHDYLVYLSEFKKLNGVQLQLNNEIYTGDNTNTVNITWKVDNGNPVYMVSATERLEEINSLSQMVSMVSNHYYCNSESSFTVTIGNNTYTFNPGHVYRMYLSNGYPTFVDVLGNIQTVNSIPTTGFTQEEINNLPIGETTTDPVETSRTSNNSFTYTRHTTYNTKYYYQVDGFKVNSEIMYLYQLTQTTNTTISYEYYYSRGSQGTKTVTYYYNGTNAQTISANGNTVTINPGDIVTINYEYMNSESRIRYTYDVVQTEVEVMYGIQDSDEQDDLQIFDKYQIILRLPAQTTTIMYSTWDIPSTWYGWIDLLCPTSHTLTTGNPTNNNQTSTSNTVSNVITSSSLLFNNLRVINNTTNVTSFANDALNYTNGNKHYYYNGTSGSASYYINGVENTLSVTMNTIYKYVFDNTGYHCTANAGVTQPAAGTITMDGILAEANATISADGMYNQNFGLYYGNFYCYRGVTFTTSNNNTYTQYGVYRLLLNEQGRFYFTNDETLLDGYDNTFDITDNENTFMGYASASSPSVGRIVYLESTDNPYYYARNNFYYVHFSEATGLYFMRKCGSAEYVIDTNTMNGNITNSFRMDNLRFHDDSININTYSGTGGTNVVDLIAMIQVNENGVLHTYSRLFKITVIGFNKGV